MANEDNARQSVDWFISTFEESYRLLAYYAAIPLLLTPELVNYLRNHFLRGKVPWVAEVDLLLSDLCRPVDAELYAMRPEVRAYLLSEMRRNIGPTEEERVGRTLIDYVRHLAKTNPFLSSHELQAQQWAAMLYVSNQRGQAVQEIEQALHQAISASPPSTFMVKPTELAHLTRLTQQLAPELMAHPELLQQANQISKILHGQKTRLEEPPPLPRTKVFFSYVDKDEAKVENLYHKLRDYGYDVWMRSMNTPLGRSKPPYTLEALKQTAVFLTCLTNNSVTRKRDLAPFIKNELESLEQIHPYPNEVLTIPLLFEPVEIPFLLAHLRAGYISTDEDLKKLYHSIDRFVERRDVIDSLINDMIEMPQEDEPPPPPPHDYSSPNNDTIPEIPQEDEPITTLSSTLKEQSKKVNILLVESDPKWVKVIESVLHQKRIINKISITNSINRAMNLLTQKKYDLAIISITQSDRPEIKLLDFIEENYPGLPYVVLLERIADLSISNFRKKYNDIDIIIKDKSALHHIEDAVDKIIINAQKESPQKNLYVRIKEALLKCEQFDTDKDIRAIFADERLYRWHNELPQVANSTQRVQAIINLLDNRSTINRENGLVLLLQVLSDQIDHADLRHHELTQLANELEQVKKEQLPKQPKLTGSALGSLHSAILDAFVNIDEIKRLVRLGLNVSLASITDSRQGLNDTIFNIIAWAERQGRLIELVNAARQANPNNLRLKIWESEYIDSRDLRHHELTQLANELEPIKKEHPKPDNQDVLDFLVYKKRHSQLLSRKNELEQKPSLTVDEQQDLEFIHHDMAYIKLRYPNIEDF